LNIGSGKSLSNIEIIDMLYKKFPNLEIDHSPAREGDVRDTLADVSLAKIAINWEPQVQLEEGLGITLRWWELI
jgi:nucleoside-diphosphate-sugar epimerase